MIHVRDLTVRYGPTPGSPAGGVTALAGLDLDLAAGEGLLVTGPSGCGKSSLARALTGLIPQAIPAHLTGTVRVAGLDTTGQPVAAIAQRVGAVFQNPATQLFHLQVAEDVAFGPRNLGLAEGEVQRRVGWALSSVGAAELAQRHPATLSGGQKQLVAIAAALAMRPQVLVLDEPMASLDVRGAQLVVKTLDRLKQEMGLALVIIEHRLAEVIQVVDRALVLDQGRAVAEGPALEVLGDRELRRTLGLRRPAERPMAPWDSLLAANGRRPDGQGTLVALEGVSAGYNGRAVVSNVDLSLHAGEFVALVGDNGAGKSTLARVIAGLHKPSAGQVRFKDGRRPRPGLDVSLLFQDPVEQLFTDSVDEEVAFGPHNYGRFDPAEHRQTLEETDLVELRLRRPTALSAGQQQRTALAACLALRPRLLILDEPTLGQDWGHLKRLMSFLEALNRQGTTILLITHDYKLVHRYARRLLLMDDGCIVRDGHPVRDESISC